VRESECQAYAPYLANVIVDDLKLCLRYTLSTWYPYQTMLMEHIVTRNELRSLEG
jgi:hypothetical protein